MRHFGTIKPTLKSYLPQHMRVVDRFSVRPGHFIYNPQTLRDLKEVHKVPETRKDWLALNTAKSIPWFIYKITSFNRMPENKWINRCIFLETIGVVPGLVAGIGRHVRSLRLFEKDKGRIHHLLEEAENERFHLFVFLDLKKPGFLFRTSLILVQSTFFVTFMTWYLISSRFSHRFVGYLEGQAIKHYT
jgi:hypothetical protein